MSGRGMSRSAPGIIHQDDDGWKIFSEPPPVAGSWGLQLREKTQTLVSYCTDCCPRSPTYKIARQTSSCKYIIVKLGKNSPARRACTHGGLLGLVQEKDSKERPALSLFESFVTSHQTKITAYLLHRLVARVINNRFQPSIPASSAMTISRVLSIAARRAPVARSSVVANVAHRGFAVAACQQLHNSRGESATSPRVGALLAAASAAMGASAVLGNDHADCCGIAGVVGGSGDAR